MEIKYNDKQLIAVDYPGTVLNVDKMVESFGGEKAMFTVFKNSTKRLELKFRPEDPYCKSAHGDRFNTTNLLLKVVKRKKKVRKNGLPSPDILDAQFEVEFLGVASTTYKFKALADFQMLPISYDTNRKCFKSLLPELVPKTLHPASWLDEETELFIPPILFSRFDVPQNGYVDIQNSTKMPFGNQVLPPNIIGRSRKSRGGFAVFATFEGNEPCSEPQPEAVAQLNKYPLEVEVKKKLDDLFKERPIWTRKALRAVSKCDRSRLKHSLPCTAYYFSNGPWRTQWVKFGYDPRKDTSSKIYQTMDLRINPNVPINYQNKRRQHYYSIPTKSTLNQQRIPTINPTYLDPVSKNKDMTEDDKSELLSYEYFPGQLPTSRQCFFQLCDIHLDAVQKLVHQNDGHEEFCHEKDGWCVPGTLEKCREILIADILKTVQDIKN